MKQIQQPKINVELWICGYDSFGGPYLDSALDEEVLKQIILEEDDLPRYYWIRHRHNFPIITSILFSL